jgi:hypothetical protein
VKGTVLRLLLVARPVQPIGQYEKAQQTKQQDDGGSGFHGFSLGLTVKNVSIAHDMATHFKTVFANGL